METAPTFDPISIDEIKAWLNIDHDLDDFLINSLIAMSIDSIERSLGHRLADREATFEFEAGGTLRLPLSPVRDIFSVTALDSAGARREIDYTARLARLTPTVAVAANASQIEVVASVGYASADEVPATLKHAVAVMVADHYLNREGQNTSKSTVEALVGTFRNGWLA